MPCAQALADLLKLTHRGCFIPPRPEKNPVEGQRANQVRCWPCQILHNPRHACACVTVPAEQVVTVEGLVLQEFVEARRAALQHYMEQLAQHPVISRSEVGVAVAGMFLVGWHTAGCCTFPAREAFHSPVWVQVACERMCVVHGQSCQVCGAPQAAGPRLLGCGTQELRAFLELESPLADNYQWRQLHPMQGSLMEGLSRLPKQLLGARTSHAQTSACCCACKLSAGPPSAHGVHACQ